MPPDYDSLDTTPEMALRMGLEDLARYQAEGRELPSKALVLFLWDEDGYGTRFINAGMKCSECVALLAVNQTKFLALMGYTKPEE